MRICIISPVKTYPPTGDSERVVNMAKGLARIGYDVHLLIYNFNDMEIAPENLKVIALTYVKLPRNRLFGPLCQSIGVSAAELTELGISAFLPSFFIRAAIGSKSSDIVLIEGGLPNPFLALLIKWFYRKKLVYCNHGFVELAHVKGPNYEILDTLREKYKINVDDHVIAFVGNLASNNT